ncbi:MAG: 3-phosphoshikimate 1-carboxyvinyltransferase [Candidatus Delongbacteria bacterium]|jgi:3-phosphoshikimate 1-carboxyvinyltransferase|nr:3-phosphoshikimate 1-carboxyvinyltransferase [Candidatus Delongbacteria bacterium]
MNRFIANSKVSGKITPPSSKSMLQRSIAASFLSNTETNLVYNSTCDDSEVSLRIVEDLKSGIVNELTFGESGLSLRMFTPILALQDKEFIISGEGSLMKRPVAMMELPLKELGVSVESKDGLLPMLVKGPIKGGVVTVDGTVTSQFLTGLLMALPLVKEDSVVNVSNLKSKQYTDMTIEVLKSFGVKVIHKNYKKFLIKGGQNYSAEKIIVENDWSSASNFIVAGAIAGSVEIHGLDLGSFQPDKNIIDIVKTAGADVKIRNSSIVVSKNKLKAFIYNATDSPDLFPPLVVLASACKGISRIQGALRLKYKESNRAEVLVKEFTKLGVKISVSGDEMIIEGGKIIGGEINSHNDHRIAMAGAISGLISEKGITVKNAECVKKSYVDFYKDLEKIMDN